MKDRLDYIDYAKGILIVLVVLGHVWNDGMINTFVYSFHMPAFFIITGILFNYSSYLRKPVFKAVLSKLYTILIPYIFFEILGVCSQIIRYGVELNIKGYIYQSIMMQCNNGPDWFLYVLFIDEILFYLIHKIFKSTTNQIIACIFFGIIMLYFRDLFHPFGAGGIGFIYICFGYYAYKLFLNNYRRVYLILATLLLFWLSFYNGKVDLGTWEFGNPFIYVLTAIAGTYCVLNFSKKLRGFRVLKYFGNYSLIIMGTHQLILLPVRVLTGHQVFSTLQGWFMFFITIIVQVPIIYCFTKWIPFCVGISKK